MPGNNPLERCYYFDELHDSHVDAWIKSLPGPSTPPLYAEEVWELGCQLWDLEHGPCEDVARKQERIEELETRLHSISPDCTRKVGTAKESTQNGTGYKQTARIYAGGLIAGNSQITLDDLATQTAEAIKFPGDPETVRDYIRDIHPTYSPGLPGRKKKMRS